jgi:hypothetical protein
MEVTGRKGHASLHRPKEVISTVKDRAAFIINAVSYSQ